MAVQPDHRQPDQRISERPRCLGQPASFGRLASPIDSSRGRGHQQRFVLIRVCRGGRSSNDRECVSRLKSTGLASGIPHFAAKIGTGTLPLANRWRSAKIIRAKWLRGFAPWPWVAFDADDNDGAQDATRRGAAETPPGRNARSRARAMIRESGRTETAGPTRSGGILAPRTLIRAPGRGSPSPAPRTGPQSGTTPPRRLSCRHAFGPIQPLTPLKTPLDVSLYN